MHQPLFSKVGWHISHFYKIIYLEGESPVVITVKEESVEDRGEGRVPHVNQEGGQELHHGGELKVKAVEKKGDVVDHVTILDESGQRNKRML